MDKNNPRKLNPQCPYLILCEGVDEKNFLIWYIKYLVQKSFVPDQINIIDLGGIKDISSGLRTITKQEYFNDMKSILIVRDAESDASAAVQSLQNSIQKVFGENVPAVNNFKMISNKLKIGFVLLPGEDSIGNFRNGTLEDLCLEILKEKEEQISVDILKNTAIDYVNSVQKLRNQKFSTVHKNYIHTFFSVTDKFVGSKIGEAAHYGCFDFSSPKLDFLECAILKLVE